MKMKLEDIIVPNLFLQHPPNPRKMKQCRLHYCDNIIDREIVVDEFNTLLDGYVLYLVLKENGIEEFDVEVKNPPLYIWGKHPNNNKKYCWRIRDMRYQDACNYLYKIAIVDTNKGLQPVNVREIFFSDKPPVDTEIKDVVRFCGC